MVVVANQQLTSIYVQSKQGLYLGVEEGLRHQLMVMGKEGMHNSLLEFLQLQMEDDYTVLLTVL